MKYIKIYLLLFSLLRALLEVLIGSVELKGEFFFAKVWFYSVLFFSDLYVLKKMKIHLHFAFLIPFIVFVLSVFLDKYLFVEFDKGIPFHLFPRSVVTFFAFSVGVPKASLILFFASKAVVQLYLVFSAGVSLASVFRNIVGFSSSYLIWQILHLNLFYVKPFSLLYIGVGERATFIISGLAYFLILSFLFSRDWLLGFLRDEIKSLNLFYVFFVSVLGYFSVRSDVYSDIVIPFSAVLGFRFLELSVSEVRARLSQRKFTPDFYDALKILLTVSLFGSTRGVFAVLLPFVILFMFFYYLPPLEIGGRVDGALFSAMFFFVLLIVSHLSLKDGFFITSEALSIAIGCAAYAFFESLTERLKGVPKKASAFATAVVPAAFMYSPEDLAVALMIAALAFNFANLKFVRFLSALYFVSKFCYLKIQLS